MLDASRFDIRRGIRQTCDIYFEYTLAVRSRHCVAHSHCDASRDTEIAHQLFRWSGRRLLPIPRISGVKAQLCRSLHVISPAGRSQ